MKDRNRTDDDIQGRSTIDRKDTKKRHKRQGHERLRPKGQEHQIEEIQQTRA